MRVLHILANGPPDVNGYAVRTHSLLTAQLGSGAVSPVALTSPWYPERESMFTPYEADGVTYHRTLHPAHIEETSGVGMGWSASRGKAKISRMSGDEFLAPFPIRAFRFALKPLRPGWTWLEEKILFRHFERRIIEVALQEKPQVIHAHTPYRVGLPAMRAARKLGIPFVYEMRGMWEETAVASGRWKSWGPAYWRYRHLETKVLRKADAVICISETLRNEAISRGVDPKRISLVPNAVSLSESEGEDSELLSQAHSELGESTVVGYIGSLREIEGVDATAEAVALLASKGVEVKLFVLSSPAGQEELRAHCKALGIEDRSVVMGPVPHEQVAPFYDLIDVFVVSRPDSRVTRLVTPLKPFEAMQRGRALVMSDLPALAEIVEHGVTGMLCPAGDVESLADTIQSLIDDEPRRSELGSNAKAWVEANRTWGSVIQGSLAAYQNALDNH
jgi:glycosyltransferase involved in cell wall biosynthesis